MSPSEDRRVAPSTKGALARDTLVMRPSAVRFEMHAVLTSCCVVPATSQSITNVTRVGITVADAYRKANLKRGM